MNKEAKPGKAEAHGQVLAQEHALAPGAALTRRDGEGRDDEPGDPGHIDPQAICCEEDRGFN
jgi:hypothetical protein